MRETLKLGLVLLAGFSLGAGAIHALHAQAGAKPAYVVAEVQVTDPPAFQAYAAKAGATVKAAGGRYLVRGKAVSKEGAPVSGTIVVIAFNSLAEAEKWYSQPPYHPLIAEREKAAKTRLFIVEGLPPK
jgi:uncharacterized protein (DUF1330 family)